MPSKPHVPNLPRLREEDITHPGLQEVISAAKVHKSPPLAWFLTMGSNPDVAVEFSRYWDMLHRGGTVPHEIKELCRIQIAQMIGCEFCARHKSPCAASITDDEIQSCALPDWEHPDAKTRAALHYARTLTLDDGRDEEVYAELRGHYTAPEIVELSAFFCLTMGGNRMAKSWAIEPHGDTSAIPVGVMSIHDGAQGVKTYR
jgi:alkylhydroperoxidase family enzyme